MSASTESVSQNNKYEKYLDERIAQTVQQVRWVELLSFFLMLAVFVLGALFVLCLVDAWIFELSVLMRWVALVILGLGSLGLIVYKVLPFVLHRINPLYAAKKLEEGRPELKNSVINYLTTQKGARKKLEASIEKRLSQKAATDVANIPLDVTVDRSPMITAGYVLTAIVALFALYKVISPKDPFQTIGRVILPGAKLQAPARVKVSDIAPGDAQKYFGETVEITARIKGMRDGEFPKLLMTSDSGTRKDFVVAMIEEKSPNRFSVLIGEDGGLRESFSYRIEAGDAKSTEYRIEVRTCPTIFIEQAKYQPAAYTRISPRVVENPEKISGTEGAVVSFTARSNLPIETAYLKLFRQNRAEEKEDSQQAEIQFAQAERSIKLDVESEFQARGQMKLGLDAKRKRSLFTHYQVVFTAKDGSKSESDLFSPIEVIPDLHPEIEIVLPSEKVVEIPEDQTSRIDLTAVDPDYGLTAIGIVAEQKGNRLFEENVFRSPDALGVPGKQQASFEFRPDQYGLKAGDEVVWFASADDNRSVGPEATLVPNRARTENYRFVITKALETNRPDQNKNGNQDTEKKDPQQNPNQQDPPQDQSQKSSEQPKKGKQSDQDKGGKGEQSPQQGDPQGGQGKNGSEGKKSDSQKNNGNARPQSQPDSNNSGKKQEDPSAGQQAGDSKSGDPKQSESNPGKGTQEKNKDSGANDPRKDQSSSGQKQNAQPKNQQEKSGGGGSKSSQSPQNSENANPQDQSTSPNPNGKQSGRTGTDGSANPDSTASGQNDPDPQSGQTQGKPQNEKEAFERLKKYFDGEKDESQQESTDNQPADNKTSDAGKSGNQPEKDPQNSNDKSEKGQGDPRKQKGSGADSKQDPQQQSPKKESSGKGSSSKESSGKNSDQKDATNNQKSGGSNEQPEKSQQNNSSGKGKGQTDGKKGENQPSGKKPSDNQQPSAQSDRKQGSKQPGSNPDKGKNKAAKNSQSGNEKKAGGNQGDPGRESSAEQNKEGSGDGKGKSKSESTDTKQAQENAGKSGNDSGSKSNPNTQSEQKGDQNRKDGDAKQSETKGSNDRNSDANQPSQRSGGDTGNANQSGKQNSSDSSRSNPSGDNPSRKLAEAEKANLDYTRKATEMVLEKLEDQQRNPDDQLLKDLNWTEDELREFTRKWQQMRDKARAGEPKDMKRFEDALKSLGLKDPSGQVENAGLRNDSKSGYRQKSGTRRVPSDFARKFRAIQKSQQKLGNQE